MPLNTSLLVTQTVVIYDGHCGLCVQLVRLIRRLDWLRRLAYRDAQNWSDVHATFPTLDREHLLGEIHIIRPDGPILAGYDGMRHLLKHLPLFCWLYPLLFLPGITWLGPKLYRWVAAHRHQFNRIFGSPTTCENDTCQVHRCR